ncbi:MAG: amidohydrolase family protein [Pseudomonadota bacterium]
MSDEECSVRQPARLQAALRLLSLMGIALLVSCSEPPPATGTAIENVTVIDAVNRIRENRTVVFDGDEILAVQPAGEEVSAAETIDGTGRYLIPGLWDFHVHLSYDDRLTAAMPELFLSWGITSVRDTGGLLDRVLPVVEEMEAPGSVAPRVFFAGPLLDGEFVVYDGEGRPEIGVSVPTPEAAERTVNELHAAGADFIKIYEMVSPEVFEALVAAAEQRGLPIDSHVPLALRARNAGPLVDSIEHLRNIELDCAADAAALHQTRLRRLQNPESLSGAELRASLHSLQRIPAIENYDQAECDRVIAAMESTVMVPTLRLNSFALAPPYGRADWEEALSRLPADVAADWREQSASRASQSGGDTRFAEWSVFLTDRMHQAGVAVGAGTDTPISLSIPGYSLHSELQMLVRAGLSPLEAIEAATLEPARYFSLENEMGSIGVGMKADMVLLDADPLADISNTKRITRVISQGRQIVPGE